MRGAAPFDGNDYRKRVLAVIDARGGPQTSDPFEYYDLPLEEAERLQDRAVETQIDAVWAFWQKSRDHPKYRGLVTALLSVHDEVAPLLRSRDSRAAMAGQARSARAAREQDRFGDLDAAIDRVVQRFGGIPRNKLDGLRRFAAAAGLDAASTESRLARHPLLDDAPAAAAPSVPAPVFRQVRADLDELGRLLGETPPASLYDLLGLPPGAPAQEVRAEREAAAARNRELRPDRRRALVDDLLAAVTTLLVDGDASAYLDAVAEDVTARLRPRVVAAVLVEDELTRDDHEHLLAEAQTAGLDRDRAVRVLADLAREAGVRAPQPASAGAPPTGAAATSGHPLRGGAGRADRTGSAGRPRSPGAGSGGRPFPPAPPPSGGAWTEPLSQARAALRAGRAVQAQQLVGEARRLAGGTLPPIRAVDDEVAAVLAEAQQQWRTVEQALATSRFTTAAGALERLVQLAADLPSPRGTSVVDALALARAGLEAAGARLVAAQVLSGTSRELALLEAARLAPDHEGTVAALADVVVAPPTSVRAERVGGGVRVSWQASTSPGPVDYRVRRGNGRAVGTTQTTELEDGLPPGGGPLPTYVVVARRAGIVSSEAASGDEPPGAAPPRLGTPAATPAATPAPRANPTPASPRANPTPAAQPSPSAPQVVTSLTVLPMGRRIRLAYPPPGSGQGEVRRLPAGTPPPAPGSVLAEPARLGDLVPAMGPGLAIDRRPAAPQLYVVLTTSADGSAVVGACAAYLELEPVHGLQIQDGRLHWQWPPGCTEVLLTCRSDSPPEAAYEQQATTRKITNTRYEIDGGAALPPERPLHVAVFTAARVHGALHAAAEAGPDARLHVPEVG